VICTLPEETSELLSISLFNSLWK